MKDSRTSRLMALFAMFAAVLLIYLGVLYDTQVVHYEEYLAQSLHSIAEVEEYCGRDLDYGLEIAALQIAKIKLLRMDTEGLASQGFSGVSESYIDGYPAEIQKLLNRKRKIKLI